jgi:hypothetical protein
VSTDYTLHVDPRGDVLASAKNCEESVFNQVYGNTSSQWDEEYGPYDASSAFLAVTDAAGEAVGCLRLITPGVVGLKSLVDVARPPWFADGLRSARAAGIDPAGTWDVATLALRKGVPRGPMLSAALYHGLFHAARANDIRWIVMILDSRVRRLLNAAAIETSVLPGTRPGPYLGSESSVPLWGELPRMADRQRRVNPDAHRLINLGIGLDGISVPPPADFVLGERVDAYAGADQGRSSAALGWASSK